MARVNISVPDSLYERLDRLRDRVNVSRVCTAALEKELDMVETRPRPSDPDVERLLQRLLSSQERWYQRGREDGRRWAVETATRQDLWQVAVSLMRIPTEQLVVVARQIRALPKLGNPFPQSFSVDEALRRWEDQRDGDVDEASYMEGWRDAVKEIWEAVKPVLSQGKGGGGAADRSAADGPKDVTAAVTQPVGDSPAYRALEEHLRSNESDEVTLPFTQIEALLGRPLPESARRHRPWWSNDLTHSHARAWMGSGWRVASVDMDDQIVTFARL